MVEREKREPRSCVGFSKWVLIGGTSGNASRTAGSGEERSIIAVACFRSFEPGVPADLDGEHNGGGRAVRRTASRVLRAMHGSS